MKALICEITISQDIRKTHARNGCSKPVQKSTVSFMQKIRISVVGASTNYDDSPSFAHKKEDINKWIGHRAYTCRLGIWTYEMHKKCLF